MPSTQLLDLKCIRVKMQDYKEYQKKQTQHLRPYIVGDDIEGASVSDTDKENGYPKEGEMIVLNRNDNTDKWLVSKMFFNDNYEPVN